MSQFYLDQDTYQFFNDGTESGSTSIKAVNTAITLGNQGTPDVAFDTTFLVRALIQEYGGKSGSNVILQLQYRINSGTWVTCTNSTVVRIVDSSNLTYGDDCTQRIGSGTFISNNNWVWDYGSSLNYTGTLATFTNGQEAEVLAAIQVNATGLQHGDTVELQFVYNGGTVLDSYTNVPTITIQKVITYQGEIHRLDFEEGDLSDWDSTGGTPTATAGAALVGSYGMECYCDGAGVDEDGTIDTSWSHDTDRLRIRFFFDPNSLGLTSGNYVQLLRINATSPSITLIVYLQYNNGTNYYIDWDYANDGTTATPAGGAVSITDAPHYVEIYIVRETADGNNDGTIDWWVDGVSQTQTTGIQDYNAFNGMLGFQGGNVNQIGTDVGYIYVDDFIVRDDSTYIGGAGTTYYQTVTGAITPTGVTSKVATFPKTVTGSVTPTGLLTRLGTWYKTVTGSITPSGVLTKAATFIKTITGSVTPSGTLTTATIWQMLITGSITPTGTLTTAAVIGMLIEGSITPTGALTMVSTWLMTITGSITPTGVLTKATTWLKTITGSLQPSGVLTRAATWYKTVTGSITPTGVLTKANIFLKTITGSITPSGTLTKQSVIGQLITGSITPTGSLTKVTTFIKSITGSIAPAGTLTRLGTFYKSLTGAITPAGTLSTVRTLYQTITGSITPSGTLTYSTVIGMVITGSITPSGTLTYSTVIGMLIEGSITPTGALTMVLTHVLTILGSVTPTGTLTKLGTFYKVIVGAITPTGLLTRLGTFYKTITGSITPTGSLIVLLKGAVETFINLVLRRRKVLDLTLPKRYVGDIELQQRSIADLSLQQLPAVDLPADTSGFDDGFSSGFS